MEKLIAIGDIHGCFVQLKEIIQQTKAYPEHKLIFLGDYIDRGPESDNVCKFLSQHNHIYLKGNHEEMLLSRLRRGDMSRTELLQVAGLSESSANWIEGSLVSSHVTSAYVFAHAGLDITKNLSEQTERDFLWTVTESDYSVVTDKLVVHGHVIVKEPEKVGNRLNINTGCGNGGRLTAVVLPEMIFLTSSKSPGSERNWDLLRKELEENVPELEIEDVGK